MAFIGTVEEYEEYQKTEKPTNTVEGTGNKISYDDLPELSEEDARIIRQTRVHHNPYDVYMQSDNTFYDEHYNKSTEVDGIDEELVKEVQGIRRLYKNYPQWCHAMNIRDEYIEQLADKYGGDEVFVTYLQSGLVSEWIPPRPIYSTTSPDYENYVMGKLVGYGDWDDELLIECLDIITDEFEQMHEMATSDVGVVAGVLTSPIDLAFSAVKDKKSMYRIGSTDNTFDGVSTNNLDELQKMVQSWISPESVKKETKTVQGMFNSTKESIAQEYFTHPFVSLGGIANAIKTGEVPQFEPDPKEMVVDDVTGRPMTRLELSKRQVVRFLAELGWDELRVMRHLGVGSNFELKLMEQRNRTRNSAKKKARSFVESICGEDLSTIEDLSSVLFDD